MNTHLPQTLQEAADIIQVSPEIEECIPNTGLRLYHVWKEQILSVNRSDGFEFDKRVDCLVADTYEPFLSLWSWLMPKEEYLCQWAKEGIPQVSDMKNSGVQLAFRTNFFELFKDATDRFMRVVDHTPKGDWYLVFADGGDLGGSSGSMFANLLNLGDKPEEHFAFMLPHEFNHQVYSEVHPSVPMTLVRSIIEEGLCCFINRLCWEGYGSPAKHIWFGEEEWTWALAHEEEIIVSVLPILATTDWEIIKKYHQWHVFPWSGAVGRLAYFLGYRLCESYAEKNGKDAWQDFYKYAPEEIWERSGYADRFIGS